MASGVPDWLSPRVSLLEVLAQHSTRAGRTGHTLYNIQTTPFQGKLRRLEERLSAESPATLQARGLVVKNLIQSPAIIRVEGDHLRFVPVAGKETRIPVETIHEVVESSNFNGSWNPGQTGFGLKVSGYWRLGFAVYDDPEPWRRALCGNNAPTSEGLIGTER